MISCLRVTKIQKDCVTLRITWCFNKKRYPGVLLRYTPTVHWFTRWQYAWKPAILKPVTAVKYMDKKNMNAVYLLFCGEILN